LLPWSINRFIVPALWQQAIPVAVGSMVLKVALPDRRPQPGGTVQMVSTEQTLTNGLSRVSTYEWRQRGGLPNGLSRAGLSEWPKPDRPLRKASTGQTQRTTPKQFSFTKAFWQIQVFKTSIAKNTQ